MDNVTDLRNELLKAFAELKEGSIEPKIMSELNNAAGKIINTAKVQIEYNALTKSDRTIGFLESN